MGRAKARALCQTLGYSMENRLMIITDLLIQKLNDEVKYWQEKALLASEADDKDACQKALKEQSQAIDTLIKMVEANKTK